MPQGFAVVVGIVHTTSLSKKERCASTTPDAQWRVRTTAVPCTIGAASAWRSSTPRRSCSAATATSTASGRTSPRRSAIGSTALYHYFESKLHCLYEIMAEALEAEVERFERITGEREDFREALEAVLRAAFDLSERDVLRNRLLGLRAGPGRRAPHVGARGGGPAARPRAHPRPRVQVGGVPDPRHGAGAIPEADARLLARAILGLYNSVFHWYRPRAGLSLAEVADFFVPRCLAVAGVPLPDVGAPAEPSRRAAGTRTRPAKR